METLPEQLSRTLMTIAKACAVMLVVASLWLGAGEDWMWTLGLAVVGLIACLAAVFLNWRLGRQEARWKGPGPSARCAGPRRPPATRCPPST